MIDQLKKFYYFLLQEKETRNQVGLLRNYLNSGQSLNLVHQMGRVGSMTLIRTIEAVNSGVPVWHSHYLHPKQLEENWAMRKKHQFYIWQRHMRIAQVLSQEIQNKSLDKRTWNIVTVVREPVSRNMSTYFLGLDNHHLAGIYEKQEKREADIDMVVNDFMAFSRDLETLHETWFDQEIKALFDIDVYDYPFPTDQGYLIINKGSVNLLILKLEQMDSCLLAALEAFFNQKANQQVDMHRTEKDDRAGVFYKQFKKHISFETEYLDQYYNGRYMKHFYSAEEIDGFRQRWSQ
ncbi:MAG: sulfotransferase family 2 domain-containing protein [Magnetococcales bacterium]|nr:sulfotransferase family 2 domain-containing protein [Magnetococcales bacterium]